MARTRKVRQLALVLGDQLDTNSAAFDELLRIIREEEPPRPSIRLSTSETLSAIAANRHSEPKKLSTLVRGELDWIVMRALAKDRQRRYQTARGFAADIRRYLRNEPIYSLASFVVPQRGGLGKPRRWPLASLF